MKEKTLLLFSIITIVISCTNETNNPSLIYLKWGKEKYGMENSFSTDTIFSFDTIFIERNIYFKKDELDSILRLKKDTLTITDYLIEKDSVFQKTVDGEDIKLFSLFVLNKQKLDAIKIIYSSKYGVLVKKFPHENYYLVSFELNTNKVDFQNMTTKLLQDTCLFPFPQPVTPPPIIESAE